jgi:hypothetical protein
MPFLTTRSSSSAEARHLQTSLNDALADALSTGYKYVRSIQDGQTSDQKLRKGLMEAASRLLQLSTDPKEYLEQLSCNVRTSRQLSNSFQS